MGRNLEKSGVKESWGDPAEVGAVKLVGKCILTEQLLIIAHLRCGCVRMVWMLDTIYKYG
jgi:hypothetical protein